MIRPTRWVRCYSAEPLLGCMCERCFLEWGIKGRRDLKPTGKGIVCGD